ncbi:DUF1802 domain-containing protein [Nostoc sp. T09]|uniref:DUF1802 family protein n=1 Tax=Nostoc sp. T09 TaxID=1932621 RepID=UPI000A36B096|nr:DUF1802 family protein [Nostoc sp. T09]OUL31749.1 DUF1802 domain-containing protein [Nostoc sp. T09]
MSEKLVLDTAFCLPACDIEALTEGRIIAAITGRFINPGRQFALCPTNVLINLESLEQYYHPSFLPTAQTALAKVDSKKILISAWAKCEGCKMFTTDSFDALSKLTVWTKKTLQYELGQRSHIFLAYLHVSLLQPIEISVQPQNRQFVPLRPSLNILDTKLVLSDRIFAQRKRQLEKLEPPLHPEVEELQSSLASFSITNPAAKELDDEIKVFLGWSSNKLIKQPDPNLDWINKIAALGNRSQQEDEGKSNYQAGTDFEIIVRKSLEFLGFTVDYFHRGGAGGVDLFCSQPYPLVGECKAGKKIPNDTAVQLLNLGTLRLKSQELFKQATKLIIGPGEPTTQLQDAAKVQDMAIINPETLEKLVKLQSIYRNSIDLFKLKNYLKSGQSDDEVDKYIGQVYKEISLRSHIIQLVKNYLQNSGVDSAGVDTLHGAYFGSNTPQKLQKQEMHEILIELSSPLTGYLGREKGSDWKSDRFYYLRDLPL